MGLFEPLVTRVNAPEGVSAVVSAPGKRALLPVHPASSLTSQTCNSRVLKLLLAFTLLLLVPGVLFGNVTREVEKLAQAFSLEFREANPDIVFKPNLGVVPFTNESPDAKRYNIGEAVTGIIRSSFSRSLIFNLIDERQRERAIDEMRFALSGLAEGDRIEPGRLEGIDYFIYGSVTQIGESFNVSMSVVEVNTARVIFTDDISLPRYDIIDYSEKLAAAYVSPYGLGLEFYYTGLYLLTGDMRDTEGPVVEGNPMGFSINYRISRNWVTWFGLEFSAGAFRLEKTVEEQKFGGDNGNDIESVENMTLEDQGISYMEYLKERSYGLGIVGLGYVFNLSRTFNITLGLEARVGFGYIHQVYMFEFDEENGDGVDNIHGVDNVISSEDISLIMVSPLIKAQYFVTPRVALNVGYQYGFHLPVEEDVRYYYGGQRGSEYSKFTSLYNLNPNIDPNGDPHLWNFSGHRLFLGLGFYF